MAVTLKLKIIAGIRQKIRTDHIVLWLLNRLSKNGCVISRIVETLVSL